MYRAWNLIYALDFIVTGNLQYVYKWIEKGDIYHQEFNIITEGQVPSLYPFSKFVEDHEEWIEKSNKE